MGGESPPRVIAKKKLHSPLKNFVMPNDELGLVVIIGALVYHPMNQKMPTDGLGLEVIIGTLAYHPLN